MSLLLVRDLWKAFDETPVINGFSFAVSAGEIAGLIGPNGAGKSTTFNLISGLIKPDRGKVIFSGTDISSSPPNRIARMGLGRTFQSIRLYPQLSVLENVLIPMRYPIGERLTGALFRWRSVERELRLNRAKASELLERFSLVDKRDDLAETLSHGQRRCLELARALALEPTLLLLDEPFGGLSSVMAETIKGFLRELNRQNQGAAILLVEHNMKMVMELCDRLIVMNEGKLLREGLPGEIFRDQAVREAYLGKLPCQP